MNDGRLDVLEDLPDERMIDVLRGMTPDKRLGTAFYLARLARRLMLAQTAQDHPDWPEELIQRHVAERILQGMNADLAFLNDWVYSNRSLGGARWRTIRGF